jgi:hypothetical protein
MAMGWNRIFFPTKSTLFLGHAKPPTKWVVRGFSLRIKWLQPEDDHPLPSTVEVKNAWID